MLQSSSFEPKSHSPGCSCVLRRRVVPYGKYQRPVLSSGKQSGIGIEFDALLAQLVQQFEGIECRLRYSLRSNQSKASVEGRFHYSLLFENVGKSPVRHHVHKTIALADGLGHPRAHVSRVGGRWIIEITSDR